jgi:hypothetical protein
MYAIPSFHDNRITIVSLAGQTVFNEIIPDEESIVEFDLSHILAGTYVLIVTSSSAIIATKKFIKI